AWAGQEIVRTPRAASGTGARNAAAKRRDRRCPRAVKRRSGLHDENRGLGHELRRRTQFPHWIRLRTPGVAGGDSHRLRAPPDLLVGRSRPQRRPPRLGERYGSGRLASGRLGPYEFRGGVRADQLSRHSVQRRQHDEPPDQSDPVHHSRNRACLYPGFSVRGPNLQAGHPAASDPDGKLRREGSRGRRRPAACFGEAALSEFPAALFARHRRCRSRGEAQNRGSDQLQRRGGRLQVAETMMRRRNCIRRRPATSPMRIAAFAAALLVIVCGRAEAITIFGSNFLSPGQQWDPGFSLFGEELSPRLDLDGLMRIQFLDQQLHNQTNNFITPQLDLQTNLQLTATQRVYALWRPIEWGAREPTFFQFGNDHGWTGRFSETPQALFYEGQPFNWLSPNDRLPLDFTLAIGRIPLFLHNGLWFNNFMDGFQLSKNNIQLGNLSNLNIMYFLTLGETQPGLNLNLANRREATKRVMGADINGDWHDYFFELSYAASYDNDK